MAVNPVAIAQINKFNLTNTEGTKSSENIETSFGEYLKNAINDVGKLESDAKVATGKLATGEIDDIHSVMIAVEKSEIALQFTMAVRNKIMDAYNEIMRMQV